MNISEQRQEDSIKLPFEIKPKPRHSAINHTRSRNSFQQLISTISKENIKEQITYNQEKNIEIKQSKIDPFQYYTLPHKYKEIQIKDYLRLSFESYDFSTCFPGQLKSADLEFENISDQNIVVQMYWQDSGGDIFSLAGTENMQNQNGKTLFLIAGMSQVLYKLNLNVPNIKQQITMAGKLVVSILGFEKSQILVNLKFDICIPLIQSSKMLCFQDHFETSFIKIACKRSVRIQEAKLLFQIEKPQSPPLSILVDLIQQDKAAVQVIAKTSQINNFLMTEKNMISQKQQSQFLVVLSLRSNIQQLQQDQEINQIRLIILLQIQSSSLIVSFPILIELF